MIISQGFFRLLLQSEDHNPIKIAFMQIDENSLSMRIFQLSSQKLHKREFIIGRKLDNYSESLETLGRIEPASDEDVFIIFSS